MHENLLLGKLEGVDFKYDNTFFEFQSKNTQIRHFWSQIEGFSLWHEILQSGKFEDADFKYENSIFKIQSKYTQIGRKDGGGEGHV